MVAKVMGALSARAVETLRKPGRHADGNGLYLKIRPGGSRGWVFMYTRTHAGKRKREEVGLGALTLAQAREKAAELRALVAEGKSPKAEKQRLKDGAFASVARAYIALHAKGWSPRYKEQAELHLLEHCSSLAARPVAEIGADDIVAILTPIWRAKPRMTELLRARLEALFDYAEAKHLTKGTNPARYGVLQHLLPKRLGLENTPKHHEALPLSELPAFVSRLLAAGGVAARALAFTIATSARSGEVLGMTWDELDLDNATWNVPPERMKSRRPHAVPLSPLALDILSTARKGKPTDRIFKLNECGMNQLMKRWGFAATPHGMRSTFRDWAGDCTTYPREVAEAALAHAVGDGTEQAYRRGSAFEKRREMMRDWSDFLTGKAAPGAGANIINWPQHKRAPSPV